MENLRDTGPLLTWRCPVGGSSARRCCGELHRVLRPHGVLLMMSGVAPTEERLNTDKNPQENVWNWNQQK